MVAVCSGYPGISDETHLENKHQIYNCFEIIHIWNGLTVADQTCALFWRQRIGAQSAECAVIAVFQPLSIRLYNTLF